MDDKKQGFSQEGVQPGRPTGQTQGGFNQQQGSDVYNAPINAAVPQNFPPSNEPLQEPLVNSQSTQDDRSPAVSPPNVQQVLTDASKEEGKSESQYPYGVSPEEVGLGRGPKIKRLFMIFIALVAVVGLGGLLYFAFKSKSLPVGGLLGRKGEVVWWGVYFDESVVKPLIEEYQANNPNVKISYVQQSKQNYRERLVNALASGKGPDIFEIHNSWPLMLSEDLATLPTSVMSASEYSGTFYPIIVENMTTSEGIVGIPLEYDAITLYINEDILASAAKQPPKTWDELRELAVELTQRDHRGVIIQSGVAMGITNNVDYWPEIVALMMLQNRVNLAMPTGTNAEDAVEYYLLFEKDRVWDAILPPSSLAFANNRLAMFFGPAKSSFEIVEANPNLRFKTTLLPQLPKESAEEPDVSYATYWVQSVWERSSSKQAAWEFLKFLSTRESLDKIDRNIYATSNLHIISPRIDSNSVYLEDPILGSVAVLATSAKSWYLNDKTYDGAAGINTRVNSVFRGVVDGGVVGIEKGLEDAFGEIGNILSSYGIAR